MTAAAYNLQRKSKMLVKVIFSRINLIGWNESNGCKSAQMSLNRPKKPEWV